MLTPAKALMNKWITKLLMLTIIDYSIMFSRDLCLSGKLLRVVSFQDQRNEITMIHGPEVDIFGDGFLACQS